MYRDILDKASEGRGLSRDEIQELLSISGTKALGELWETAYNVKKEQFGDKVFTYGFVYFSTFCKNNCSFCYYRRSNSIDRYRKTADEIVSLSESLQDSGVNLVDLTMGEDHKMHADNCRELVDLVRKVDSAVSIPIMLSPGAVDESSFAPFRDAGADWFACYQETHNRKLFAERRIEQDYDRRFDQRTWARKYGMLAEDGIMVGIGETYADVADSIVQMGKQGCEQIRVMTFVPQEGTPMSSSVQKSREDELKVMAVMRLAHPDRLIPASLDVEGIEGLIPRIRAGANIVTSIVPPHMDLAGVAQKDLDIDSGRRFIDNVIEILEAEGCRVGSNNEYGNLLNTLRGRSA
ncbi:MAG: methylornithine synthase PylB [Methanomassiliicoccaceae archaeon]|jgi:methylornithine synthase|nr:methylornithine synthase PylB [Methanomassiliicoccaceae archaeon]